MKVILEELVGLSVQVAVFLLGLVLSVAFGMLLATRTDSIPGLVIATVLAGAGLLSAASFSQTVRDRLAERQLERILGETPKSSQT